MSEAAYPAPVRKAFNRHFWEAIDNNQLKLQECTACGARPYTPRLQCPKCFGDLIWTEADGTGVVHSYGIVHRPNQPAVFDDRVPIVVAIVELDEGPLLVSDLINCDPEAVAIGDEVRVVFDAVTEDVTLPKFELV
jgi:uncharacterized OB-fold protein